MKKLLIAGTAVCVVAGASLFAYAQSGFGPSGDQGLSGDQGRGGHHGRRDRDGCHHERGGPRRPVDDDRASHSPPPPEPYLMMFDTDGDQMLSAEEIKSAGEILLSHDHDGDGTVDRDELPRPPTPGDTPRDKPGRGSANQPGDEAGDVPSLQTAAKGTVRLLGGHQTNPVDGGRPVALIAAALGVETQVFRDAFADVRPAHGGPPSPSRARVNKEILMTALSPHGVTNDRLDTVSNYYRYRPETGSLWTHRPAKIEAIIEDDQIDKFKIVDAGHGYMKPPRIVVAGYPNLQATAEIEFNKDMSLNGRIVRVSIDVDEMPPTATPTDEPTISEGI